MTSRQNATEQSGLGNCRSFSCMVAKVVKGTVWLSNSGSVKGALAQPRVYVRWPIWQDIDYTRWPIPNSEGQAKLTGRSRPTLLFVVWRSDLIWLRYQHCKSWRYIGCNLNQAKLGKDSANLQLLDKISPFSSISRKGNYQCVYIRY